MKKLSQNSLSKKITLMALLFVQEVQSGFAGYADHGRAYSVEDGHGGGGSWILGLVFIGILYAVWNAIIEDGNQKGKDRTLPGCLIVIAIFFAVCMLIRACH